MHNLDLFYWKTAGHFTLKFGKGETFNSTFVTLLTSANIAFLPCANLYSRQPSFMRQGNGIRCVGCASFSFDKCCQMS